MKNILSRPGLGILAQYAWSKILIAFDYDGTLAPIVADPEKAKMRLRTRDRLEALARRYRVIVISGRAQPDALSKLQGVGVREVLGNHGIEPWHSTDRYRDEVQRWRPVLDACIEPFKGVTIEDKRFSVAIHYRHSREKKKAMAAILRTAATLDVRVIGGKHVINLVPTGAPHKGIALERERERLRCDAAIYVGDDETDEDVFALDLPGRLLAIRVGAKRTSAATYFIPNQRAVDDLLDALLVLHGEAGQRRQAIP